jgi:HSP20 family protein
MKKQLVVRDPFVDLVDSFERMFYSGGTHHAIPVNVSETEDGVSVMALVPGVKKEDMVINFEKGTVSISVTTPQMEEDQKKALLRREIPQGEFKRSLYLGNDVDGDSVQARYENGVLHLRFGKREETKPRQITVS